MIADRARSAILMQKIETTELALMASRREIAIVQAAIAADPKTLAVAVAANTARSSYMDRFYSQLTAS